MTVPPSAQHMQMRNSGLRIGRHYSPGGKDCLEAARQILEEPASAFQMFGGGPRRYWCSNMDERQDIVTKFRSLTEGIWSVVHNVYITNFAADATGKDDSEKRSWNMSIHSAVNHLQWAELMGFDAVVIHPGSTKGRPLADCLEDTVNAVREVMIRYEGPVHFLLENAASTKKIGGRTDDLTMVCEAIKDERLGFCIDTTHAFASGYAIHDIAAQIEEHRDGLLRLVHFNTPDDTVTLGSNQDRHSSLFADGAFTKRDLQKLFLAARELPLILEGTPDLASDLCWLLRWELQHRAGELIPEADYSHDDIFALGDPA